MKYTIPLGEAYQLKAKAHEQYQMRGKRAGGNYTGLEMTSRFFYGNLGEYAFYALLKQAGKSAKYDPPQSTTDDGDFLLHMASGHQFKVDVKTGSQDRYQYFLLYESQIKRHGVYNFYVAVNLFNDQTEAKILGYCKYHQLRFSRTGFRTDAPRPTWYMRYADLKPIDELLDQMLTGEVQAPAWWLDL